VQVDMPAFPVISATKLWTTLNSHSLTNFSPRMSYNVHSSAINASRTISADLCNGEPQILGRGPLLRLLHASLLSAHPTRTSKRVLATVPGLGKLWRRLG
jgi:hypothetical protein